MQLDLFAHSRDVMLRNDVIASLRRRDAAAGRQDLAVLRAEYPGDSFLAPANALLDVLAVPCERFLDHDTAADALRAMDAVVTSANRVFGTEEARDWLAPVWRSLAHAAKGLSFDAGKPQTHAASMLLQGSDWAAAEEQVASIASWRRISAPLAWMAEARFGQGGLDTAWCLLVELAWIDASAFSTLARRLEAPPLQKLLDDFDVGFEAGGEADPAWFPAWALIVEPGLAAVFRTRMRRA